jgi:hypothetical protein
MVLAHSGGWYAHTVGASKCAQALPSGGISTGQIPGGSTGDVGGTAGGLQKVGKFGPTRHVASTHSATSSEMIVGHGVGSTAYVQRCGPWHG